MLLVIKRNGLFVSIYHLQNHFSHLNPVAKIPPPIAPLSVTTAALQITKTFFMVKSSQRPLALDRGKEKKESMSSHGAHVHHKSQRQNKLQIALSTLFTCTTQNVVSTKVSFIRFDRSGCIKCVTLYLFYYYTNQRRNERDVYVTYLDASFHFPPVIPNVLPQLNPSHPHHSINVPSIALVGEAIMLGLGRLFSSNFPKRGLR